MFTFELAPGILMDRWVYDRPEVVRTDLPMAIAFRREVVDLRKRLDSLIDTPDGVLLIISGAFVDTIRARYPKQEAYGDVRGSGLVGGRTAQVGDHIEVVLNGCFLLTGDADGGGVVNEQGFQLTGNTLTHEAQHVIMHQRGTVIDDMDLSEVTGYASGRLAYAGLRIADEYRAEAAAYPLRTGPREKFGFGVAAAAAATDINKALDIYDENGDVYGLMARVLNACQPLWVGLAYFAASLRKPDKTVGTLPPALGKSRLWVRYIGPIWPQLANVFALIPDARQDCPPELLQGIAVGMIKVARSLLLQMGFTFEDEGDGAEFLIQRRDFPR